MKNKKIVYIAHPISAPTARDIRMNIEWVLAIVKELNLSNQDIVPFAPYIVDCIAMDDSNPIERQRGIDNDIALFRAKFIKELWLYGNRISGGMEAEVRLAVKLKIPVVGKTEETILALPVLLREIFSENKNQL